MQTQCAHRVQRLPYFTHRTLIAALVEKQLVEQRLHRSEMPVKIRGETQATLAQDEREACVELVDEEAEF